MFNVHNVRHTSQYYWWLTWSYGWHPLYVWRIIMCALKVWLIEIIETFLFFTLCKNSPPNWVTYISETIQNKTKYKTVICSHELCHCHWPWVTFDLEWPLKVILAVATSHKYKLFYLLTYLLCLSENLTWECSRDSQSRWSFEPRLLFFQW